MTEYLVRWCKHQAFKLVLMIAVVAGFCSGLAGCASPQTIVQMPNPPHYSLVDNLGVDSILAPPQRNQYDPKLYRDPDVPFAKDLKGYNEYIAREVVKLEMRTGSVGQTIPVEKDCRPFVLPPRNPEPRFRPSSLSDRDRLLEEALSYAKTVREHYATWSKQVDDEYASYRTRCKL